MPPFTLIRLKAAGQHGIPQNVTVLALLRRYLITVGPAAGIHEVENRAHIQLLMGLHIHQRQIHGLAAGMTGTTGDVTFVKHLQLFYVGIMDGLAALIGGIFFFCLGAAFSYFVALPFMIQFLVNFSQSDFIHSSISVAAYLDFMIGMLLTFGLVFEEPMLAFVLTSLGVLTPQLLKAVRSYAIPVIFALAAIITPPDVVSQFMVAVPMIVLYELSILISAAVYKRRQRAEAAADSDENDDEEDDD